MKIYKIVTTNRAKAIYNFRGDNERFIYSHDPEVIISGPAETGKTFAACTKPHLVASKYPGAQLLIVRKSARSLVGSVLRTWGTVTKGAPYETIGGVHPERYVYANGSVVWLGGMDNPDKILSSEYDMIYVNQAEELHIEDWETLATRVTGRGAVVPFPQLTGDCNPGGESHWILKRSNAGSLRLLHSTHKDNPTLFDDDGKILPQGERSLGRLATLTGARRDRLFLGKWSTPEGLVYKNFDGVENTRVINDEPRFPLIVGMDFNVNPMTAVFGIRSGKDLLLFEELEMPNSDTTKMAKAIRARFGDNRTVHVYPDPSGSGRHTAAIGGSTDHTILRQHGFQVIAPAASYAITDKINTTNTALCDGNGLRCVYIDRDGCPQLIAALEGLTYMPGTKIPDKRTGLDHLCDAFAYMVCGEMPIIKRGPITQPEPIHRPATAGMRSVQF